MWSAMFLLPMVISIASLVWVLSVSEDLAVSWQILSIEISPDLQVVVDDLSVIFIFTVATVSAMVFLYSNKYVKTFTLKIKFVSTLSLFMISMLILSLSADLFWVMVGWDGLGLTSLCLIMFFQNWKSFNSSMVTFLSNRVGDFFIILSIMWMVGLGGTNHLFGSGVGVTPLPFLLLLGAISKSAQIPYSAWLPLAMAAPTPVSSLVHSSTLVTAGVYLLARFGCFMTDESFSVLFFLSFITVVMAGSSAMGEMDLKKVIALSTLSHVGLMLMFLSMGMLQSVKFHLFAHAIFKALLFMIAGDLIHYNSNFQDIRMISMSGIDLPLGVGLVFSLMSMVGLPFLAGFFSKEEFIVSSSESLIKTLGLAIAVFLTAGYSVRIGQSIFLNSVTPSGVMSESSTAPTGSWFVFFLMSLISTCGGVLISFLKKSSPGEIGLSEGFFLMKWGVFLVIFLGALGSLKLTKSVSGMISNFQALSSMWWVGHLGLISQRVTSDLSFTWLYKSDSKGLIDGVFFEVKEGVGSLYWHNMAVLTSIPLMALAFSTLLVSVILLLL